MPDSQLTDDEGFLFVLAAFDGSGKRSGRCTNDLLILRVMKGGKEEEERFVMSDERKVGRDCVVASWVEFHKRHGLHHSFRQHSSPQIYPDVDDSGRL